MIPHRYSHPSSIVSRERTFFVTSSILGKRMLLQSTRSAELLINVICHYREFNKYKLHAFVVMPDHFHALLTLSDLSIEKGMQLIKGGFSFRAGKELGFSATVWQKGFSEIRVSDARAFARIVEYIHQNPVRGRLSVLPDAYPFSSAFPGFLLDPPPQRLKPGLLVPIDGMAEAMP